MKEFNLQAQEDLRNACATTSIYDLGRAGIGIIEDQYKRLQEAAKSLVQAVEGYVCPKKGDKYVFRNEVLAKCNALKKLLNETE